MIGDAMRPRFRRRAIHSIDSGRPIESLAVRRAAGNELARDAQRRSQIVARQLGRYTGNYKCLLFDQYIPVNDRCLLVGISVNGRCLLVGMPVNIEELHLEVRTYAGEPDRLEAVMKGTISHAVTLHYCVGLSLVDSVLRSGAAR